jgi:hypothetical protein
MEKYMTAEDYPIRPQLRVVSKHDFPDYRIHLLEQPDISVDLPYILVILSENLAMGVGDTALSFATQVEAIERRDQSINFYLNLSGKEHFKALISTL